jgi:predicted kinase
VEFRIAELTTSSPGKTGVLHFMCGRAGAGKSTLARKISADARAVLFCEDQWLVRLFDGAPTLEAYVERRGRIRKLLEEHVPPILAAGHSVVFDFGGNTIRDRSWVRSVFESAGAVHELHYIVASETVCRQRVAERNRTKPIGIYWGNVSEAQLEAVNSYFQTPAPDEGFTIVEHDAAQ